MSRELSCLPAPKFRVHLKFWPCERFFFLEFQSPAQSLMVLRLDLFFIRNSSTSVIHSACPELDVVQVLSTRLPRFHLAELCVFPRCVQLTFCVPSTHPFATAFASASVELKDTVASVTLQCLNGYSPVFSPAPEVEHLFFRTSCPITDINTFQRVFCVDQRKLTTHLGLPGDRASLLTCSSFSHHVFRCEGCIEPQVTHILAQSS